MPAGYEQPVSPNGDRPSGGGRSSRTVGIAVAVIAFMEIVFLGGILLGFLLVLDPVLQAIGVATAVPGVVMVGRSFAGALRVGVTGTPDGIRLAWRRAVFGSLLFVVPTLGWAIVAVSVGR